MFQTNLLIGNCSDTKPFFQYIKSQQQDSQGISSLCEHGQLFSDAPSKVRILNEQFKLVFRRGDPHSADKRLPGPLFPAIHPASVDTYDVQKLLHNLSPRKASGPDEIPARLLLSLSVEIALIVTG